MLIEEVLNHISEQQRLIIFYSSPPTIDDGFSGGRVCSLGAEIARTGAAVIILVSAKDQRVKLQILFKKYVIHEYCSHFSDVLTQLARRCGNLNIFVSSCSADIHAFSAIQRLQSCGWCTLYDMGHDLEDMHRLKLLKSYSFQVEATIARSVEGVIAVSTELREKARSFGVDRKIALIPNATALLGEGSTLQTKQSCNGKPIGPHIVGYFGSLDPVWLDWPSVVSVAQEFPAVQFEIIGDDIPEGLCLPDNIRIFEGGKYKNYKKIISNWSIGLVPLRKNPLSMSIDPIIVYDYLSMGLSVLASPDGPMRGKSNVLIYDGSAAGLRDAVEMTLNGDLNCEGFWASKKTMAWSYRAAALIGFIDEITS
ncbi:hypothetical protein CAP48_00020 [Advenella sp. S44]|uniref:hypothetical protein n=1 Tax=Advenella sp. S44 TaxID=1982755 RepID=UPI000C2A8C30|nr:hypothetical protein [Advenella sp. S44]PJX27623.1 hypothetical protein CAP48_00020 [Advenella sp. S44]